MVRRISPERQTQSPSTARKTGDGSASDADAESIRGGRIRTATATTVSIDERKLGIAATARSDVTTGTTALDCRDWSDFITKDET